MGCGASTHEKWDATALERKMSEGTVGDKVPEPCPRAVRRRLNRMVLRARLKDLFHSYEDTPPEVSHTQELGPVASGRICDWVKRLPSKHSMVSVITYNGMSPTSGHSFDDDDIYEDTEGELVPATDIMTATGSLYAPRRLNDERQISRLQFLLRQRELTSRGTTPPAAAVTTTVTPSPRHSHSASPRHRMSRGPSSNIFPQVEGRRSLSSSSVSSSFMRRPSLSSCGFDTTRIARAHPPPLKISKSYNALDESLAHLSDV